jgi:hypothetical protein
MLIVIYAEFVNKSIMLCVILLNVIMLNVLMLSVVVLNVGMLSVVAPVQECLYSKPNNSTAVTASSTVAFASNTANLKLSLMVLKFCENDSSKLELR